MKLSGPSGARAATLCFALILFSTLTSCGRDTSQTAEESAADITGDFVPSPVCPTPDSCEIAGGLSVGHGEPVIQVRVNPNVDDPVARWGRSLAAVVECADGGDTLSACVAQSDARDECKREYARLAEGDEPWREAAAFDAVFLVEGALCRPAEDAQ